MGWGCAGSTAKGSTFPARESDILCCGIPSAGQRGRLPPLPGAQVTRLGVSVCTEPLTHARQGPGRGSLDGKLSEGGCGHSYTLRDNSSAWFLHIVNQWNLDRDSNE